MFFVASASRYHPRYKSRSSMYIRGLISQAVPIVTPICIYINTHRQLAQNAITLISIRLHDPWVCTIAVGENAHNS